MNHTKATSTMAGEGPSSDEGAGGRVALARQTGGAPRKESSEVAAANAPGGPPVGCSSLIDSSPRSGAKAEAPEHEARRLTPTAAPPQASAAVGNTDLATIHATLKEDFAQFLMTHRECWCRELRERIPRHLALARFRMQAITFRPSTTSQVAEGEDLLLREVLAILEREGACTVDGIKVTYRQEYEASSQATDQAMDRQGTKPAEEGPATDLENSGATDANGPAEPVSSGTPHSPECRVTESKAQQEAAHPDRSPEDDATIHAAEKNTTEATEEETDSGNVPEGETPAATQADSSAHEERASPKQAGAEVTSWADRDRTPMMLAIDRIRPDGGTQVRVGIHDGAVKEYASAMQGKAPFPPVVVYHDGTTYWLADGFHRVAAARRAGLKTIATNVRRGTRRDAILHAVGANASHGLRRTNADKRRAVTLLLTDTEWGRWSDCAIARRCGVSDRLVRTVRAELPSASPNRSEIGAAPRKANRKGQTYTVRTGRIGSKPQSKTGGNLKGAGAEVTNHPLTVPKGTDDQGQVELHQGPESAQADGPANPVAGVSAPAPPDKLRTLTIRIGLPQVMAESLVRHLGRDRAAAVRDALTAILNGCVEDGER